MNKCFKKALTEGIPDLVRFMEDNPEYTDIKYVHIDMKNDKAEMQVLFSNGYLEVRFFDEDGVE